MLGVIMLVASFASAVIYGWLLFFSQWTILALQLTCFIATAITLTIVAWIGYTLATTPPPKSLEEIEKGLQKPQKV
jgi:predicted DNA-binding transcriptional regulator